MTLWSIGALFGAMLALALVPDASAMAVMARSMGSGFSHGFFTTLGILAGDLVFILVAIFGLTSFAGAMEQGLTVVAYLGGAYLVWVGLQEWRTKRGHTEIEKIQHTSLWSDFLCGVSITLGDPKAILFYVSFLPAFLDLPQASLVDVGIILILVILTAGGVKLGYALMGDKTKNLFQNPATTKVLHRIAGLILMGTGFFLIGKSS